MHKELWFSAVWIWGEGRMNRWSTPRGFLGQDTILYNMMMVDTCHYTFIKSHRMYNTKRELEGELWTSVNNNMSILAHWSQQMCHTLMPDVDNRWNFWRDKGHLGTDTFFLVKNIFFLIKRFTKLCLLGFSVNIRLLKN